MSTGRDNLDNMTFIEFIEMLKEDVRKFEARVKHNMMSHPEDYAQGVSCVDPDEYTNHYENWFEAFESSLEAE